MVGGSGGRGQREGEKSEEGLVGDGLSVADKQRLVAQYGDLSNDEADLYPSPSTYNI